MSNNHLNDVATFVAVVEAGSFTRAAARLGFSKAGVSRQVQKLEARLGSQLLRRTTRSLSLTEAGSMLYETAANALSELQQAEAAATSLAHTPHGRLRVSLPTEYGRRVATRPLLELAAEHPMVELDLSYSDRFVDLVREGFDLAVRIGELSDSSLIARRLGSTRRVVCASPTYLERRPPPRRPSDLAQHSCLLYSGQQPGPSWRFANGETATVRGRLRSDSGEALLEAAIAGFGVVWLPDFYVAEAIADRRLVPLLGDCEAAPLGVWAVYPPRRHLSLKLRMAVDHLAETIGGTPGTA